MSDFAPAGQARFRDTEAMELLFEAADVAETAHRRSATAAPA
jgi:hypothetical protein